MNGITHPKVARAVFAGGSVGSLSIVLIWLLGLAHVQVDPVVAGVLAAYLTGLASWLGGWLAPIISAEQAKIIAATAAPPDTPAK